jgi:hypothetical protein
MLEDFKNFLAARRYRRLPTVKVRWPLDGEEWMDVKFLGMSPDAGTMALVLTESGTVLGRSLYDIKFESCLQAVRLIGRVAEKDHDGPSKRTNRPFKHNERGSLSKFGVRPFVR